VTINGSIGGGVMGMAYSYICFKKKVNIPILVTGILSGLVSITAICSLARPWEAILIGALGALLACPGCALLDRLHIDDPVGCVPTHCFAGIWGLISVALFGEKDILENQFSKEYGIFKGGPWRFLGVQMLMIVSVSAWAAATTFLELYLVDRIFGLRVSEADELLGADHVEHGITEDQFTFQGSYDAKDKGTEQLRSVEINVLNELPITSPVDMLQRNENGDKSLRKSASTKRKILRRKWRKALSITKTRSESQRNSDISVQLSYVNGLQNGSTHGGDVLGHHVVVTGETNNVLTTS